MFSLSFSLLSLSLSLSHTHTLFSLSFSRCFLSFFLSPLALSLARFRVEVWGLEYLYGHHCKESLVARAHFALHPQRGLMVDGVV